MLRVVPDTNVLISALGWEGNEYRLMELCFKRRILPVTSLGILNEFREAASKPELRFSVEDIDSFLSALMEAALVVQPSGKFSACRDPEDDRFLEAAVEGKADYVVSGDKGLLVIGKFRGVKLVNAAKFLKIAHRL